MAELDVAQLPPPARRVVEICVGEERPTLEAFLDYYRDAVTRKVSGVSEADARRQNAPYLKLLGTGQTARAAVASSSRAGA